jgi:hypothetical protein
MNENEQEVYENLPRDPEQALLHLERYYRERCVEQVNNAHNDENVQNFWAEYIGRVLAAIRELGLATQFDIERMPKVEEINYQTYLNFGKEVEFYRTQLLIRHGRRLQGYSVALDPATKQKIGHHLAKIREIVDKLNVDDDKREALYSKIEALQLEVDRDRTRLDAFADLVIEAAGAVGDCVEQLTLFESGSTALLGCCGVLGRRKSRSCRRRRRESRLRRHALRQAVFARNPLLPRSPLGMT